MIKKLTILILLFSSIHIVSQENQLTWYDDVSKAIPVAVAKKKPIMLFFTGSDWCGWCKRLVKEVFDQKEFKDWAKDKIIPVEATEDSEPTEEELMAIAAMEEAEVEDEDTKSSEKKESKTE